VTFSPVRPGFTRVGVVYCAVPRKSVRTPTKAHHNVLARLVPSARRRTCSADTTRTSAYFDAMGHYTRWDAVSLSISDETLEPIGGDRHTGRGPARDGLSAAEAQALSEEYDVPIEAVEAVADAVAGE
jgi:hypothetical protein